MWNKILILDVFLANQRIVLLSKTHGTVSALDFCYADVTVVSSCFPSQNRGVYMFRIDNDHVIDATLTGGPAR